MRRSPCDLQKTADRGAEAPAGALVFLGDVLRTLGLKERMKGVRASNKKSRLQGTCGAGGIRPILLKNSLPPELVWQNLQGVNEVMELRHDGSPVGWARAVVLCL